MRTSVLSVTRHPHSVKIRCRYPALDFTVTESVGHFGQLKKPDELRAGIRKSLPASLPKSTGQNGPLKGVKGERLAQ